MLDIKEYVAMQKVEIKQWLQETNKHIKLVIVNVGDDPASKAYIRGKLADCAECGIETEVVHFEADVAPEILYNKMSELNTDDTVTGYIVQLPLPKQFDEQEVIAHIAPEKDVDGFTARSSVAPATPQGIINYLTDSNFKFEDANAVVIGRSNIVGKPMAALLLERNCNVTQIHSHTSAKNKIVALQHADLVIVATGHRNTLMDMDVLGTNQNCLIIDVGMNRNEDGKLCGDCEAITLRKKTPVPGGVGLLTRLALLSNVVKIATIKY